MVGTTHSHYRIFEKLGQGGMGVVYRAEDTNLNRQVAIKVLLEAFAGDRDRMARFEREAKLLASLSHQNIASIFGLEEAEGKRFIVMELAEGETLAKRISRGPLPGAEALEICRQVADGLEAAHEKGIVHRDLKPSNVMITPEGKVKILDFGLAKALTDRPQPVDLSDLTTTTGSLTKPGAILGTAAYMSPEQARGKAVDKRGDIWAFGCILFECLTGTKAFTGETIPDTFASVLNREPDWGSLPPTTPPAIRKLLKRCLNKNSQQRLHDIADARIDITEELEQFAEAEKHPANTSRLDEEDRRKAKKRLKRIIVWCSLLAIPAAVLAGFLIRKAWDPSARLDRPPMLLTALVTWPSDESRSRISPDNKWVSFISDRDGHSNIWLRNLDGAEPVQITKQADTVTSQVWSPKGDDIAYLVRQGNKTVVQAIPAFFGGAPHWSFSLQGSGARLVRWIGSRLYVESNGVLQCVNLPPTNPAAATVLGSVLQNQRDFDISPDEKSVVFTARRGGPEELWVSRLDGGNPERLTDGVLLKRFPVWMGRRNSIIYQSSEGGQIDLREMRIQDRAGQQITSGSSSETPEDVSADGSTLIFRDVKETANLWWWNRATGARRQITADALTDFWASWSETGKILAFQRTRPTLRAGYSFFESQIFSGVLKSGTLEDVVMLSSDGYNPRLSADGRWLAYQKWPPQLSIAELWVEEVGRRRILPVTTRSPVSPFTIFPLDVSSVDFGWNDDRLYFIGLTQEGIPQIRRYVPESETIEPEVVASAADARQELRELRFSPDKRYLSYVLNSNDHKLYVHDLVSGKEWAVFTQPTAPSGRIYSRGWLDGRTLVVLRSSANPDLTARIEIMAVDLSGKTDSLGAIESAFPATARLNAAARKIYVTAKDGVFQNVYEFGLADRKIRRLTDNELPGVTFSGIEAISENELVFTRHARHGDIWMIRFQR